MTEINVDKIGKNTKFIFLLKGGEYNGTAIIQDNMAEINTLFYLLTYFGDTLTVRKIEPKSVICINTRMYKVKSFSLKNINGVDCILMLCVNSFYKPTKTNKTNKYKTFIQTHNGLIPYSTICLKYKDKNLDTNNLSIGIFSNLGKRYCTYKKSNDIKHDKNFVNHLYC